MKSFRKPGNCSRISSKANALKVVVIGAGFSGISAAWYLCNASRNRPASARVTVFESSDRVGGVVNSRHQQGFLIEESADSFIVNKAEPWAMQLAEATGFADQLIPPNLPHRRAFVLRHGTAVPVPDGLRLMAATKIMPVLQSRALSWTAKWRLLAESWVARQPDKAQQESLREFAERRVGKAAFEQLVQPLVSGIYTADPDRLSMAAALPQFVEFERQFGSISRGLKRQSRKDAEKSSGARYGIFRTAKNGLGSFAQHVADRLPDGSVRLQQKVQSVERANRDSTTDAKSGWLVRLQDHPQPLRFDAVLFATPASVTAKLLATEYPRLADKLGSIEHAGVAVACLGYRRADVRHGLEAFGLVIPTIENRDAVAISFSHRKFPHRAANDHVLLRVFLGGALRPDLVRASDEDLVRIAKKEVRELLHAQAEPILTSLSRWDSVTPQYHVGHVEKIREVERIVQAIPDLAIAGNAFHGIGIPQCIRSGRSAAESLLAVPEVTEHHSNAASER